GYLVLFRDVKKLSSIQRTFISREKFVLCVGEKKHDELISILSKCHFFLYPTSFKETFCISAVEAQALGLECVLSDVGALRETCIEPIIVREAGGDDVWIEKTYGLVRDFSVPQNVERRARVAKLVREKYGWSVRTKEWLSVLTNLVGRTSKGSNGV